MARPTPAAGLTAATPASAAARAWLSARLHDVRHQAGRTARALEEDPVHDLRVALRRLRAACALFGGRRTRRLERALKRLQDAAGAVRDLHVELQLPDRLPPSAALAARRAEIARALAAAGPALLLELARFNSRVLPRLERALARLAPKGRLGGHRLRRRLARLLARAEARRAAAGGLQPVPAHRLRIALKKVRYGAELLLPAFPAELGALVELLVPLQEGLGRLHDADVHLAQAEARGEAPAPAALRERAALARKLGRTLAGFARTTRLPALRARLLALRPANPGTA